MSSHTVQGSKQFYGSEFSFDFHFTEKLTTYGKEIYLFAKSFGKIGNLSKLPSNSALITLLLRPKAKHGGSPGSFYSYTHQCIFQQH
jgi:hypothetical protein